MKSIKIIEIKIKIFKQINLNVNSNIDKNDNMVSATKELSFENCF